MGLGKEGAHCAFAKAHKPTNPEGWWQRLQGDGEPIPTAINFWEKGGPLRVRGSAQTHKPGGVVAKVSGRWGTNPDRNFNRPMETIGPIKSLIFYISSTGRAGRLGQPMDTRKPRP